MQNNNEKGGPASPSQGGLSWSQVPQEQQSTPAKGPVQKSMNTEQNAAAQGGISHMATYAGLVAAGVIIGVLIAWGWSASRTQNGSGAATTQNQNEAAEGTGATTSESDTTPAIGSDSLTILTPQAAGMSVTVTKAIVSSPTWVVVYDNRDGKPGNVLGAALFFPERQAGSVTLLRATSPGKTYFAGKRVDDGDRKFSLTKDSPLLEGGEAMLIQFETK